MDLQDANWERFCRYHIGDWYGLWTPYTVDGVALTPRQCIRSFQLTADGRAITHQNHYRYADGRQETKTFGPYTPATTRGVFVEASFSWGRSYAAFLTRSSAGNGTCRPLRMRRCLHFRQGTPWSSRSRSTLRYATRHSTM